MAEDFYFETINPIQKDVLHRFLYGSGPNLSGRR